MRLPPFTGQQLPAGAVGRRPRAGWRLRPCAHRSPLPMTHVSLLDRIPAVQSAAAIISCACFRHPSTRSSLARGGFARGLPQTGWQRPFRGPLRPHELPRRRGEMRAVPPRKRKKSKIWIRTLKMGKRAPIILCSGLFLHGTWPSVICCLLRHKARRNRN